LAVCVYAWHYIYSANIFIYLALYFMFDVICICLALYLRV